MDGQTDHRPFYGKRRNERFRESCNKKTFPKYHYQIIEVSLLTYRLQQHQEKLFGIPEQFALYKASYTAELVHLLHGLLLPFNVLFFPLSSIVRRKVGT